MVDGADTMLEIFASGAKDVQIDISTQPLLGSDLLQMTERCDPYVGGAYYQLEDFEGESINQRLWLCQVTEFVFGDLPEKIYVRRSV